ncbi:MAG: signal recognition particle-docking protein FtsY [Candidatus Aenigmarchaeota archaeon]|nr:signal recognition particle-docking protein FtsY [Candidatus Aenigmarchaeota archaeon]
MFGSLKKKLKEAIGRVSGKFAKEDKPKEEITEELKSEEIALSEESEKKEEPELIVHELSEDLKGEEEITTETLELQSNSMHGKNKVFPNAMAAQPKEKRSLFKRIVEKELTEEDINKFLPDLQKALLANDVAFEVAEQICEDMKSSLLRKSVSRRNIESAVRNSLKEAVLHAMKQDSMDLLKLVKDAERPFVILFLGHNGTGKTTTLAKVANYLKKNKLSSVLVAADTFRAASIEQLQEHADRLGIRMIKQQYGADPAAVLFDGKKYAEARNIKAVLCDSAGRSHSNVNLMDELKKIVRVNKPDLKVLILDSLTGNDIYDQAKLFNDAVGIDAIILTKADVYDKGGAALSASHTIKKPIIFLGTGQSYDDLLPFDAEKIAEQLVGA